MSFDIHQNLREEVSDAKLATLSHTWEYEDRRRMQEVAPCLYVGPYASSKDKQALIDNGVNVIILLRTSTEVMVKPRYPDEFEYHMFELDEAGKDSAIPTLRSTTRIIRDNIRQGKSCLCVDMWGIGRVSMAAIAYIITVTGCSSLLAFNYLHSRRACVYISQPAWDRLIEYEPLAVCEYQMIEAGTDMEDGREGQKRKLETLADVAEVLAKRGRS
uniref:Tyrosine-protein phosphatase domain-containing protein n=1 Tax=Palpitomonas bilix TaxID=652834 RepID=A0A7S3GLU9_9EUKA|mmetsp:Transcript_9053/g.24602  ORF Transcript_9053/g.24602 Transcript_9053/m.24602 type:complete len:216 (+) Transcript_9053:159-806(+)